MNYYHDELYHYGVLGMKWGVRKRSRTKVTKAERFEKSHDDYKKAHTKKDVNEMSDTELRSRINRLQMEKQYKQLTKHEVASGEKFVKDLGKEVVKNYLSKQLTKGIEKAVEKTIDTVKSRK